MTDWLTILHGDCREVLRAMAPDSIHAVVTSPPYWNLRSYGVGSERGELGLEATPEEYVDAMVGVFREVRRVLRPDGSLWLNLGDTYAARARPARDRGGARSAGQASMPPKVNANGGGFRLKAKDLCGLPWRVALALQADGWWLRRDVVWSKPNPIPESAQDRPTTSHEYLFLLTPSARYFYDAEAVREPTEPWSLGTPSGWMSGEGSHDSIKGRHAKVYQDEVRSGRHLRSVWSIPTQAYPGAHFATFPERLVEPCIKASTSERGVCGTCGAPWARTLERTTYGSWSGDSTRRDEEGNRQRDGIGGSRYAEDYTPPRTTGWRPGCGHDGEPVPAVVLDPFGGTGTTAVVAQRLRRRAVLIELSETYVGHATRRASRAWGEGGSPPVRDEAPAEGWLEELA